MADEKYARVKCDCGHYPRDHYIGEGCCDKCGCTWYHPNYRYVLRKRKELGLHGIKFRQCVYDSYKNFCGFYYWGFIGRKFIDPITTIKWLSQQYISLNDKNDREIYEGDKYQWKGYEVENGKQIRPIRTGVVTWDYHELTRIQNIIEGDGTLEIIGNIYENPELCPE